MDYQIEIRNGESLYKTGGVEGTDMVRYAYNGFTQEQTDALEAFLTRALSKFEKTEMHVCSVQVTGVTTTCKCYSSLRGVRQYHSVNNLAENIPLTTEELAACEAGKVEVLRKSLN